MNDDRRLAELEQLIEEFKRSGLRELQARCGDFEIFLSLDADAAGLDGEVKVQAQQHTAQAAPARSAAGPAAAPAASAASAADTASDVPEGAIVVRAPYLGTFYRSPKPGSAPYVEIGSSVTAESELCLVEVMKLFTAVRAGVAGKVVQVLASDGDLVSADQPLFAVMPL
jgi:acetyl-CoA carboxylase biotin carboxyl carrier protein